MTPKLTGTPVLSATEERPRAASPATKSKCGLSPRITTPPPPGGRVWRAGGGGGGAAGAARKGRGPRAARSGPPAPPPAWRAATAPSASFLEMGSLKRAATTAKRPRARSPLILTPTGARPAMSVGQRGEEVAHLLPLRHEVATIGLRGRHLDGHPLDHLEPVALDADDLLGVVGEDAQPLRPEVHEDLRADAVVAEVGLEAEGLVGLHGVLAVVLDLVGAQLVDEADAAPFLAHVHEDAAALALDDGERLVELRAT